MAIDLELSSIVMSIKNKIDATMRQQTEICKKMFVQHAKNDVLGEYVPTQYKRRSENGSYGGTTGVADEQSYDVTVDGNSLTLTIVNDVRGNPRYSESKDGWDSENITDIIESGSGYNWKRSEIYQYNIPRPWMEQAGDDFVDNLLIPMIDIAMAELLGG